MFKQTKKCKQCGEEFEALRKPHKFCSSKCCKKYNYYANLEKKHAYFAAWREENREKVQERYKEWVAQNPNKVNASRARYNEKNPEQKKESRNAWRAKDPEKARKIARLSKYKRLGYSAEFAEIKELQYQIKKEIKNQQENN